jgi:hypothetical protein
MADFVTRDDGHGTRLRTRRKAAPATAATTFRGRDQDGGHLFPAVAHPAIALVKTQQHAQDIPEAGTYYVERQTLFGPAVDLYAVERTEDGRVLTWTLSTDD